MKWVIEFFNNKVFIEGKDTFDMYNKDNMKRIFLTDGNNEFGFYLNGLFFVNNQVYDFKTNANKYDIIPFQNKTGKFTFNMFEQNNHILSHNIGYFLINNDLKYEYKLSVFNNNEAYLYAYKYYNDKLDDYKVVKLG